MRSNSRRGYTLVELLVVIAILGVLVGLTLGAIQRVRAAALRAQCLNQLRQQGLGLHQFHAVQRQLPAGVVVPGPREPNRFMTWMTQILPHVEQQALWKETLAAYKASPSFLLDPPHVGLSQPLAIYACPLDPRSGMRHTVRSTNIALTSYQGVNGTRAFYQDGVLFANSRVRFEEIRDGTSTTLMVGERPASADLRLGWWYAGSGQDLDGECDSVLGTRTKNNTQFAPDCAVGPFEFVPGRLDDPCAVFHFWSPHAGGANFLFADGSVRFLSYSANSVMHALGTRHGREAVAVPD